MSSSRTLANIRGRRCPLAEPAGPVISPPAPPPTASHPGLGLSPPPARGPRPPLGSAAAAIGARPPQKGVHWPGGKSFSRRIPPPVGLRGNFLIIVTPKTEKPRAGPEGLSQSESQAAVRLQPRCVGQGPGFQGGGQRAAAAAPPPRSTGHRCQRAAPGGAAAAAGRFPRRPGAGRTGRSGRGACSTCGAPLGLACASLAFSGLTDQELPRPERPEAALKMGAPPTPTRVPAIQEELRRRKSKTGSPPFLLACPYLNSGAPKSPWL